jgi:diaminopimelate decarboxylase
MTLKASHWGFCQDEDHALVIGGARAEALARRFGTPLHVIDESGLRRRARDFRRAFESAYPAPVSVHYALKCNNVPAIARMVLEEGLLPEVGTEYEWRLVRELGIPSGRIIVNGPHKGPLLSEAVREGAGLIVVDGPQELEAIKRCAATLNARPRVLIRVNPNFIPKGMNRASATGSRRHSVFGFDLATDELRKTLEGLPRSSLVDFKGLHCHIGTGIRSAKDYIEPLERLVTCAADATRLGLTVDVLDIGGGFGVPTSRELNTREFLTYQALGRLPKTPRAERFPSPEAFAKTIVQTLRSSFHHHGIPLPRLIVEPGRSITSGAGVLLVTVGSIKSRAGVGTWAITDGGTGTVAFPLHYEYHEVLLCRSVDAPRAETYTMVGPACFSADWIYRNKQMPPLQPGDVLAICDAGAYFTVQESNFGFPRPAIVAVQGGETRLLRRRETFDDLVSRDLHWRRDDVASIEHSESFA